MSLLVVGSVAFDAIDTPFASSGKIVGGAATYISLTASYFYKPVKLVSVVGGDFPQERIRGLEEHGIDTEGLQVIKDDKTFFWAGKYHNDMNSRTTLETELNVLGEFDPVLPNSYQDCKYLMLGNLSPVVQRQVIERLHKRPRLIVMDTMNFWMDTMMDELLTTIKMVDVLSINDEEARQLSGEFSLVKAAKKIMEMGPKVLVIKKGEHGALLFNESKVFFAPALPLEEVYDPTGAGDTFAGGFIGYLAKSDNSSFENMKKAIIFGSAMASYCVERFGTERLEKLTLEKINKRVRQFIDLVQLEGEV
jgi:sugar/nucleoside kinase (ribokinase family)